MEFMNNKKIDMEISKHFLNQLFLFETRLNKSGQGPKTSTFTEISNENDIDEVLLRNTYLNGLENKVQNPNANRPYTSDNKLSIKSKKINWADKSDNNRRDLLCNINPQKELYFIKDIKPIMNHKKMMPSRSCMKRRAYSSQGSRSPYKDKNAELQSLLNTNNNYNSTPNSNFVSVKNYNYNPLNNSNNNTNLNETKDNSANNRTAKLNNDTNANRLINNSNLGNYPNLGIGKNLNNINDTNNTNKANSSIYNNNSQNALKNNSINNNNFNTNSSLQIRGPNMNNKDRPSTTPNNNQRSFSYDQKDNKQNSLAGQNTGANNNKKDVMKIIITPQVQNVYNQNVNNIYIQNPQNQYDLNMDKNKTNQNNSQIRNQNLNDPKGLNYPMNNRPNSVNKKDYNMSLNKLNNNEINKQPMRPDYNSNYNDKLNRNFDSHNHNQKYMHNNYLSNQNVLE